MADNLPSRRTHRHVSILALVAGCSFFCGCGVPASTPTASRFITVEVPASINPAGGTLQFPAVAGYSASFVYSSNNASGATASLTTTIGPVVHLPGPPPTGIPLISFEFALNENVTFVNWYRLPTGITIPTSIVTSGHSFAIYGYDVTTGVGIGVNPGTVVGNTITFPPGLGPVTLTTHKEALILMMK